MRYGQPGFSLEVFLGSVGSTSLLRSADPHRISELAISRICLGHPPTCLDQHFHSLDGLPCCVTPSVQTLSNRYRNIHLFPITYAFQPRLRGRLTLGGLPFPRKPWVFGEPVSHRLYRYSCQHSHFHVVHQSSRSSFNQHGTLPYHSPHPKVRRIRGFGD